MKLLKPVIFSLVCALLLTLTNQQTSGVITENQAHYAQRLLRSMIPDAVIQETGNRFEAFKGDELVGYISQHQSSRGYNGRIEFLLATTPHGEILSVRVVSHSETPGIGDKIEAGVSDWINIFDGKSSNDRWQLAPTGDFDGITGATITARAMVNGVREALGE
jgi:electron transport complex protein RnfG